VQPDKIIMFCAAASVLIYIHSSNKYKYQLVDRSTTSHPVGEHRPDRR
jgi:hypothetical protein